MQKYNLTIANANLAGYPNGGGHWSCFIQYMLGLSQLRHNFYWLEFLKCSGNPEKDKYLIDIFFQRLKRYGLAGRSAVLLYNDSQKVSSIDEMDVFGLDKSKLISLINDTDILWNLCCSIRNPFLSMFRNSLKVLIDLDPGILQISDLEWNLGIEDHDIFFTVGSNVNDRSCKVPTKGKIWNSFFPAIYMPMWYVNPDQGMNAPFTSITHWKWGEYWYKNEVLSISKRDAYLRYLNLPILCQYPFELAANIHPKDRTGDRENLKEHGWKLRHPYMVARTIQSYQHYIQNSRGEFSCAKPIYTQLKTGWFSDRSAAYLASGRPVIAEDTGFSAYLPTGCGLIKFDNIDDIQEGINRVIKDYSSHQRAARRIAEEYLDSRLVLSRMLGICK